LNVELRVWKGLGVEISFFLKLQTICCYPASLFFFSISAIMKKAIVVKSLSLLFCLSPLHFPCDGQSVAPDDSAIYRAGLNNTIRYFYANSKSVCTCLNGKEYIRPPFVFSEGSPYFLGEEVGHGTLTYDHVFYDSVQLLYDELQDNLLFVDETHRIQLLTERVERFSIDGHPFIHIEQGEVKNGESPTGYFELVYEGNSLVLKKEEKKAREVTSFSAENKARVIDTRTVYYLRKGNRYVKLDGRRTFYDLWAEHQKEIKGFIKANKLKFKDDLDIDYAKLTAFCDRLSPVK
jgi:hypothetical protein